MGNSWQRTLTSNDHREWPYWHQFYRKSFKEISLHARENREDINYVHVAGVIIDNIIIYFLYVLLSQVQLVNIPCNIKSALRIDYLEFCK